MAGLVILLATVPFIFGAAGVAAFCAGSKDDQVFADIID